MIRIFLLLVSLVVASAAPARADYHDTVAILRIGMLETHPAMADPLRVKTIEQAYSQVLNLPVEIIRFPNLAALIDAHASARVKYVIHTAVSYAATEAVCGCVTPLRRPVGADGTSGFRSVLVMSQKARHDPPKIAYSRQQSLSGWVIPAAAIQSGSLPDLEVEMAGSVSRAVAMLADGQVDGLFGWIPEGRDDTKSAMHLKLFNGAFSEALKQAGEVNIAWLSDTVFNGPHAVHRSLPKDMLQELAGFLDEMPQTAPGLLDILEPLNSGGYQPASKEDYHGLVALVASQGTIAPVVTGSTPKD